MAILEQFDLAALPPAALHHLMLEAKKIAFADRNRLAGDPEHVDFDAGRLYAPEYARRRAAEIRTDAAGPVDGPGLPEGDTTYLCAVDREGNAVSLIHSIYSECGNGEVIDGLGFWLNNRAKAFRLVEGHPNCIAPLKRPMHTLNCFIVTQDGLPCYVGGTPGADGQPQWNMQVLVNLIDLGMGVQEAIEAPRWRHYPGTDPATLDETPVLTIEAGFPDEVYAALRARGHSLQVTGPFETTGKFQLIRIDRAQGVLHGGSDPRGDGMAAGI
jgi:gamma-glutamyltranspeptidase / glutathione hydrolase